MATSSNEASRECCNKPSGETLVNNKKDESVALGKGPRKFWEVSGHCSSLLFPSEYPDVEFETSSGNYYYLLHTLNSVPDQELVKASRGAFQHVLSKLNSSELQVKHFILPLGFMRLKYIDPYSRQKIIEQLCKFFSSQTQLRCVVLEEAKVTFADLCRFLLAIVSKSLVKCLCLWGVLDECNVPFKGPLKSDVVLDDLPRIPYTHNPGGRKYLTQLKESKERNQRSHTTETILPNKFPFGFETIKESEAVLLIDWLEKVIEEKLNKALTEKYSKIGLLDSKTSNTLNIGDVHNIKQRSEVELQEKVFESSCEPLDLQDHVFTQFDVGLQCDMMTQKHQNHLICHIPHFSKKLNDNFEHATICNAYQKAEIKCCSDYLKKYKNSEISKSILVKIYLVSLGQLTNLTTLSVDHTLIADGTGEALLSIGSIIRGKLKDLKILCEQKYIPSDIHDVYTDNALHVIPDTTWNRVKKYCPNLRVHMVCVSMSCYDITRKFLTRSIPVKSIHINNGFCPTLEKPQLMIFNGLKFMNHYYNETLENVDITLWHSSGRIDSALEKLVKEVGCLRSFAYHGPIQYKRTVNHLCEIALCSSNLVYFELLVQGDPCFANVAHNLTENLYQQYLPKFNEKNIKLRLGTHNS